MDEDKKSAASAEPEKKDEAVDTEENNSQPTSEESQKDIDYKAELDRKQKQLSQAEFTIEKLKKDKEKKEDDENQPQYLTPEQAEEFFAKKSEEMLRNFSRSAVESRARGVASNDDEYNLIMFNYDNVIKPTGDITEDIENARLLANKTRYKDDLSEAQRAALSKNSKSTASPSSVKTPEKPKVKLSPQDKEFLDKWGVDPEKEMDPQTGEYKKA